MTKIGPSPPAAVLTVTRHPGGTDTKPLSHLGFPGDESLAVMTAAVTFKGLNFLVGARSMDIQLQTVIAREIEGVFSLHNLEGQISETDIQRPARSPHMWS